MSAMQDNYFKLFGMPEQFAIDENQLRQNWHRLQQESHPDRHVAAPSSTRIDAMQQSLAINTAYRTLADPVARAWYLIVRAGGDIAALQRYPLPHDFLEELIGWREALADLQPNADGLAFIDRLRRELNERRTNLMDELETLFAPPDTTVVGTTVVESFETAIHEVPEVASPDTPATAALEAQAERVLRLQFIEKTRAELKEAEARLLDDM